MTISMIIALFITNYVAIVLCQYFAYGKPFNVDRKLETIINTPLGLTIETDLSKNLLCRPY
jgi:hypothetical protein